MISATMIPMLGTTVNTGTGKNIGANGGKGTRNLGKRSVAKARAIRAKGRA